MHIYEQKYVYIHIYIYMYTLIKPYTVLQTVLLAMRILFHQGGQNKLRLQFRKSKAATE